MKYLKTVGKAFIYIIGILFITTFFMTLLSYFNIISSNIVGIIKIIIPILSLLVGGFIVGKSSKEKGWLEGLKLSLIVIVIIMLLNYLGFGNKIAIKNLLYYLILIISSIFGSMIGINKRKEEN